MTQCVDDMVASLQDAADTGTTVNVGEPFERLTIDVILRCVMGVQSDLQKGGTNDEQALLNRVATHRTAVILGKYRLLLSKTVSLFPFGELTNPFFSFRRAERDVSQTKRAKHHNTRKNNHAEKNHIEGITQCGTG